MIIHEFLIATVVVCPQARMPIPSTEGPFVRPFGMRVAGAADGLTGASGYGSSPRRTGAPGFLG